MNFSKVTIKNFGPFFDAEYRFTPGVVNWVVGASATGKTELAGAMVAAIVGRPAIVINEGGTGPSQVELVVEDGSRVEDIRLSVSQDENRKVVVSKTPPPLSIEIMAELSAPEGQELIIAGRKTNMTPSRLSDVEPFIPDSILRDPLWLQFRECGIFERVNTGSGGQRAALELVKQFVARRRARLKLPMLIDDWTWRWPENYVPLLTRLLDVMAGETQVIVFATHVDNLRRERHHVVSLPATSPQRITSLARYESHFEIRRPNLKARPKDHWVQWATFPRQEDRTCELKEVKGGNPLGSIKGVVDQYAVAFMNAGHEQEGAIFWGIRDHDRAIVGVELNPQECDELRRIVTERLHQIVPPIAPSAYRIYLHQVSNGRAIVEDLYVVEVRIPATRRTLLFATGGQEVYVKTDGGKRRLSILELQQELVRRLGVDPDFGP
nr:RNA-binding domain-containing protein [uncultured Cupriavidus sp.]